MERAPDPSSARKWCARERAAGRSLGFVPTMGALHAGHLRLVERARRDNDRAVVSVFVNPLQFDDPRDFERYPRDLEADAALLSGAGCDLLFSGTLDEFFPESGGLRERIPWREAGPTGEGLEGAHRQGHFRGVATIVARLFEVVEPTRAYFGAKDFQQTLVVRDLAQRMGRPEIVVCPTVREPGGLALSSRNALLTPAQREQALAIHAALQAAAGAWRAGVRDAEGLAQPMRALLARSPLEVEYAEVRDPHAWSARPPPGELRHAVALVAARLGAVRLIDNLRLDGEERA